MKSSNMIENICTEEKFKSDIHAVFYDWSMFVIDINVSCGTIFANAEFVYGTPEEPATHIGSGQRCLMKTKGSCIICIETLNVHV